MIDRIGLIQQSMERTRQRQQQKIAALQAPRRCAALILKRRLEAAIAASGGDPSDLAVQGWLAHFAEMYILLAGPLDQFPVWRDEGVPPDAAADFFDRWMGEAAKALNAISPSLGK